MTLRFSGALLASLLLLSACGGGKPGPNVLLIVVDTLRADHLGVYGHQEPTSPRMDALAARGVRLEDYTSVVPSTLASVTSLLTSRHPHDHGVFQNGVAWPAALEGVQSDFQAAGYQTAGFIASYTLSSTFGVARGFDHFDEEMDEVVPEIPHGTIRRGAGVSDEAIRWLEQREPERPFFALVHYFDPHYPYSPPPPYDRLFDPDYQGDITGTMADVRRGSQLLSESGGVHDADTRHLHSLHLGEIRYTDDQIGRLLDSLDRLGLAEGTLVVLTADHGETFHEHFDHFDHGATVYQTEIHVPLILAGPGVSGQGRSMSRPCSSLDLAPTLLEATGLAGRGDFQGLSLWPEIGGSGQGPPAKLPDRFAEATKPFLEGDDRTWPNRSKAHCLIRDGYKLVRIPWLQDRWELFRYGVDSEESRNLWADPPVDRAVLDGMVEDLNRWSAIEPDPDRLGRSALDPEARERLEALGYLQ